jgi:NAD(P)-dependent dehydrogenase (short-subunit alcohol dehydrogenase family)
MLDKLASISSNIHPVAGDLADVRFLNDAVSTITAGGKKIHILINNAGLLINKPFEMLSLADWQQVYSTNVFSLIALTQKLLPHFSGEMSHIVNISSMGGFQGSMKFKGLSAYSSSKAAVVGLTECLAEELKDKKIAVNCLCLGSVNTEMFSKAFPGYHGALSAEDAARFICRFALEGAALFNGKIIPVSSSTP